MQVSAARIWFSMNFNSSRQIWKPIQIIQLQVWLGARLEFFVRSDLYLSFFLWLFMGRLERNWNWWPLLTFSTGLKFQLAAMATGPWKLDPDRSREKLKTATAALNWRKVAYNCQRQALNWNNLPFPVLKKKKNKREMNKKAPNKSTKPENQFFNFFRQKSLSVQSTLILEVAATKPAWWKGSQTCTHKGLNHPDQTRSRSQTVARVKSQVIFFPFNLTPGIKRDITVSRPTPKIHAIICSVDVKG